MTDCWNDFLVVAELSAPGDRKLDSKSRGDGALRQICRHSNEFGSVTGKTEVGFPSSP